MLESADSFPELYKSFSWDIPTHYNIGVDVCDRWAEKDPERIAIIDIDPSGNRADYSFQQLKVLSNRLANALRKRGVGIHDDTADRVGVLLPQCVETAVSHIALFKLGVISIPLFTLFAQDALLHRLSDSGAKVVITNAEGLKKLQSIREQLPSLKLILCIDDVNESTEGVEYFYRICDQESDVFSPLLTRSDDPALLIYTSGTTGNPKGALHAHRVLLGHLPGVEISHNFLPLPDDRFWTPADWAWIGGLLDVLMPSLHHGIAVVAYRFPKFDAESAVILMRNLSVRNAFLPPTVLKMMMSLPESTFKGLALRSIGSGGETLGAELLEWGRRVFKLTINEFYGQTECNMIVSSCSALEPATAGYMGRPVPGHNVKIINPETGLVLEHGNEGAIAVESPNPVMFLRYWNNPEATAEKYVSSGKVRWLLTGDRGAMDESGKIHFVGRDDDVISSAGYRIGPSEIENCLVSHEAVQLAGVVGKPDSLRGSVVLAFVTLNEGFNASEQLSSELGEWVKLRLAAHEYPREIRFIDNMPMTTTGKIIRATLRQWAQSDHQEN